MQTQQPQKVEKRNYKEQADERKKQQVDQVWQQVSDAPELAIYEKSIVKLRKKLGQANQLRQDTNSMIKEMKNDYGELRKNIKDFIRKQNNTQTKSTAPKKDTKSRKK